MNLISQLFSKIDLKITIFHCWLNLFVFHSPEYLNNSWWCFSSSFLDFEDRRRVPFKSLPILPNMRSSILMPSSHNCFRLWEFFSPIRSVSWVVSISFLRRSSGHNSSFSACSYRSPNLTGASFKYPLISSWSLHSRVYKSPQVSSFVFQFYPVNSAFATLISNSYGGSFKILFFRLSYQFIRCFNPTGVWRPPQVWRYIYLNPFYENK